ncbi:MAG: hypothetical protein IH598_07665 [Bacteroidales bacterium]|nr:hypothetical protein [Bacteroidales bacterium]
MNDLTLKFNLLEPDARKQVLDFIEFLLSKELKSQDSVQSDYKKKILEVSVWSDADVDLMIQNQQNFNQWKAQEW